MNCESGLISVSSSVVLIWWCGFWIRARLCLVISVCGQDEWTSVCTRSLWPAGWDPVPQALCKAMWDVQECLRHLVRGWRDNIGPTSDPCFSGEVVSSQTGFPAASKMGWTPVYEPRVCFAVQRVEEQTYDKCPIFYMSVWQRWLPLQGARLKWDLMFLLLRTAHLENGSSTKTNIFRKVGCKRKISSLLKILFKIWFGFKGGRIAKFVSSWGVKSSWLQIVENICQVCLLWD